MTKCPLQSCPQSGIQLHLFAGSRSPQELLTPPLGMRPASPSPANNLQRGIPSTLPSPSTHSVLPEGRQGLEVVQRGLGCMHSLHAGVDGASQGLLG